MSSHDEFKDFQRPPFEDEEGLPADISLLSLQPTTLTRGPEADAHSLSALHSRDVFRSVAAEPISHARGPFGFGLEAFDDRESNSLSAFQAFGSQDLAKKPATEPIGLSSAFVEETIFEPPPAPGGYLEPQSHVLSNTPPADLFPVLKKVLQSLQVDLQRIRDSKFKLLCLCYRGSCRLSFVARVFTVVPSEQYAVEFQRREGNVIHFAQVFDNCRRELAEAGVLCPTTETKYTSGESPKMPPPPPFIDPDVTATEAKEAMRCLGQMANSPCADVKAQAMQALAQLSFQNKTIQAAMIEEGAFDILLRCVDCPVEDVHRCALTAVANLSKDNECVCESVLTEERVQKLISLANSQTTQVVRECARVLANVAETLGTEKLTARHPSLVDTIDRLSCSTDTIVCHHVTPLVK